MELLPETEITKRFWAAKVVVARESDGHLLILRRSIQDERRPGEPDFPGGELETGETYAAAARRETKQEAGIDLGGIALAPLCEITKLEDRDGTVVAVTQMLFHAMVEQQDLEIGDEHSGGGWYSPDEAAEMLAQHPTKLMAVTMLQQRSAGDELALAS
ncbi:MAG: NUDIX hydrolase [Candidatus Saccharimonadales bacterium]|jgi:8-oxo-dGTP pyrophosphatase MutT (NUDIX family)